MVSNAIMAAGMITAHGLRARPARFSLIIIPQLAAGGCWPKPRKASPDMMMIEYVRRSPASTISGVLRLGRISLAITAAGRMPCNSAAFT